MKEWPLVFFTLLIQTSIGVYLWTTIVKSRDKAKDFCKNTLFVFALGVIAMLISLGHLGVPGKAYGAIFNLKSSWLSREIFFTGAFVGMVLIDLLVNRRESQNEFFGKIWSWITSIVGMIVVFAIAQIYMNSVMPAWQSTNTLIDFYATTIIMGGMVFILTSGKKISTGLTGICLTVLAVALLQVAFLPNFLIGLESGSTAAQSSVAILAQSGGAVAIRWLLVLAGAFFMVVSQMQKKQEKNYIYFAAIALIIGQLIGRYLFYAAGVAIGIGLV